MTTAWAHCVRGQFLSACTASLSGTLLAMASSLLGPWALVSGLRGRCWNAPPSDRTVILAVIGIVLLIFAEWTARLMAGWES
jgi:hypothetical protein